MKKKMNIIVLLTVFFFAGCSLFGELGEYTPPDVGGETGGDLPTDVVADSGGDTNNNGDIDVADTGEDMDVLVDSDLTDEMAEDMDVLVDSSPDTDDLDVANGEDLVEDDTICPEPNLCGGCSVLPSTPDTPCGTCESGFWRCNGAEAVTCVGDEGDAARNGCGGCTDLIGEPGGSCGQCPTEAFYVCAGQEAVRCTNDRPTRMETCDGLDNDCDGEVDDGLTAPFADRQDGVCEGAVRICAGADGWVEPEYGEIPLYEANEVSCDGEDNDCDGETDNGLLPPLADRQDGVCVEAVQICAGADGWVEPEYGEIPLYEANEVSCDGEDNDCDGQIDEDDEGDSLVRLTLCGLGICAGNMGFETCVGGEFRDNTCDPFNGATPEICDGLDNDCDGETDEDLFPPFADRQDGVCEGAVQVCAGNDGWVEPEYGEIPLYEEIESSCDGEDNDCDGDVDNVEVVVEDHLILECEGKVLVGNLLWDLEYSGGGGENIPRSSAASTCAGRGERLPTDTELISIFRGCDDPNGCPILQGPGEFGFYWQPGVWNREQDVGVAGTFWSGSGDRIARFVYARIDNQDPNQSGVAFWCVRPAP